MSEDDEPAFAIPQWPVRRYHPRDGLEYDGGTVFVLTPEEAPDAASLVDLLEGVLDAGPYRYGDWLELPMPLYVVHDTETADTFRVAVREGTIQLHVLPDTEPRALRAVYARLRAATAVDWEVTRTATAPES